MQPRDATDGNISGKKGGREAGGRLRRKKGKGVAKTREPDSGKNTKTPGEGLKKTRCNIA